MTNPLRLSALLIALGGWSFVGQAQTLYDIGDPTDEEQLFVELINRAREDANAEAQRLASLTDSDVLNALAFYSVDLELMVEQFATLTTTTQPLAINAALQQAAYLHSLDQFNSGTQTHTSTTEAISPNSPGDSIGDRIGNQGYTYRSVRENVFSYAESVEYGHAGFEIDWGDSGTGSIGGMQSPPGHREAIHDADMREIGVGIVYGTNQVGALAPVGPMVVTQNFGEQLDGDPFITGVAFLDIDGDQFYDVGEGIGGIELRIPGSAFYAATTTSGGYSLPVTGNGTFTISISGPNVASQNEIVSISNLQNNKLDLIYEYAPSTLSAPSEGSVGNPIDLTVTEQFGATGYELSVSTGTDFTDSLGAENGTAGITFSLPEDGDLVQTAVKASGLSAYQLSNLAVVNGFVTGSTIEDAWLEIDGDLLISTGSTLAFEDRVTTIASSQVPAVEISTDGGATWTTLVERARPVSSESSFTSQELSLDAYANQTVRVRFILDHRTGSVTFSTAPNTGWFIDNIKVSGAQALTPTDTLFSSSTLLSYTPRAEGSFIFQARALNGERPFPYGPVATLNIGGSVLPDELVSVFPEAELIADDWAYVDWFGLFNTAESPWIYHTELGWLYAVRRSGDDGVYFYHPGPEWLWTTEEAFPYLCRLNQDRWLYVTTDSSERAWFYDFAAEEAERWITFD